MKEVNISVVIYVSEDDTLNPSFLFCSYPEASAFIETCICNGYEVTVSTIPYDGK